MLTRLAEPLHELDGDQRAAKAEEREVNIGPTLVSDSEAPKSMQPGQRPLDHPAVSAHPVTSNCPPRSLSVWQRAGEG